MMDTSALTDTTIEIADHTQNRPLVRAALSVPVLRRYLTTHLPDYPYRHLNEWLDEEIVKEACWLLNVPRESSALYADVQHDRTALEAFIAQHT
jgi:hypothetical protein